MGTDVEREGIFSRRETPSEVHDRLGRRRLIAWAAMGVAAGSTALNGKAIYDKFSEVLDTQKEIDNAIGEVIGRFVVEVPLAVLFFLGLDRVLNISEQMSSISAKGELSSGYTKEVKVLHNNRDRIPF